MTKKINWKWKYEELNKVHLEQKNLLENAYTGWIKTLDDWNNSLGLDALVSTIILIGGIFLGLIIGLIR